MEILITFAAAIIPVFVWLILFYWWDRKEPEPPRLIAKLFIYGAIIGVIIFCILAICQTALVSTGLTLPFNSLAISDNFFVILFVSILIAVVHELVKFFFAQKITFSEKSFTQIVDGVVYFASIALGAAFIENIFTLISNKNLIAQKTSDLVFQFIFTTLMLTISAGFVGLALGKEKSNNSPVSNPSVFQIIARPTVLFGLFYAIFFHAAFRSLLYLGEKKLAGVIVITAALYLFSRFASSKLTVKISTTKEPSQP